MAERKSVAEIADIFGLPASTVATILEGNRIKNVELEIIKLTRHGKSLAEIADKLCVTKETVVDTLTTARLRVYDFF